MMKILPSLRGDTPARIETARQALAASAARIAQLEQDRTAAIADADDLSQISTIDLQLADEHRTAQAARDRLAALEARLISESAMAREKAYAADVAAIDVMMLPLEKAAAEVEAAVKAVAVAARRYSDVAASIAAKWPAGVPKASPHYLSLSRLGGILRASFSMMSLVHGTTRSPPAALEFVRRAITADERAEGFATTERTNRVELLAELRQRGAPVPVVDDDEEVAA
jgi:hypothetical protein